MVLGGVITPGGGRVNREWLARIRGSNHVPWRLDREGEAPAEPEPAENIFQEGPRLGRSLALPNAEAPLIVPYFLISLFPLGVYLLILAGINRRERPCLVSGVWDAIALSLALSGIFLWIGPALLAVFYQRGMLGGPNDRQMANIWELFPWVWISYYLLVIAGQALMAYGRRHKTLVYNVSGSALEELVHQVLVEKGYRTSNRDGLIFFDKGPPETAVLEAGQPAPPPAASPTAGAVDVESFPSLRHATLHWHIDERTRQSLDNEITARLEAAATPDNPSVSWLLGISAIVFGFVLLGATYLILATLLPMRM